MAAVFIDRMQLKDRACRLQVMRPGEVRLFQNALLLTWVLLQTPPAPVAAVLVATFPDGYPQQATPSFLLKFSPWTGFAGSPMERKLVAVRFRSAPVLSCIAVLIRP